MRMIITGLVAAALGLLLLSATAGAQTGPAYPPPTPTTTTLAPQASAEVGGVSITRQLEPDPVVAVGGVVLERAAAGPTGNALARTGSNTETLVRAALLAVAVGGAAMLAARRRPADRPVD